MYPMNSEENQGFLGWFFAVFDPEGSHILHKCFTEITYDTA